MFKQNSTYVTVIGGSNIDITGFPYNMLKLEDSNPGIVKLSLGGVGRNISENLAKLGVTTKLITVVGDDIYGRKIIEDSSVYGIDMEESLVVKNRNTSTYLSVLDNNGDMMVAISHMDICDNLTVDFIKSKSDIIKGSKVCVIDTNIPMETIEYLLKNFNDVNFFVDTVSCEKTKKILNVLKYIHTIKPNKKEAEVLADMSINSLDDVKQASRVILSKGVRRVFISLGEDGVFYSDGREEKFIKSSEVKLVNATGAGDAFMAALVYGYINHYNIHDSGKLAMGAANLALCHEDTINPNMSLEKIQQMMEGILNVK